MPCGWGQGKPKLVLKYLCGAKVAVWTMKKALFSLLLLLIALPVIGANAEDQSPAAVFAARCSRCHGADGKGNGLLIRTLTTISGAQRPADFTDSSAMSKWSDKQLAGIIANGGAATGGSKLMPAYGESLSAAQISELVKYIRSLSK